MVNTRVRVKNTLHDQHIKRDVLDKIVYDETTQKISDHLNHLKNISSPSTDSLYKVEILADDNWGSSQPNDMIFDPNSVCSESLIKEV